MPPYPSTTFKIQKYYKKAKFNGVSSRNNLLKKRWERCNKT